MKLHPNVAIAAAALLLFTSPVFAENAVGKWTGTVKASEGPVAVSVTIVTAPDGTLAGTSQSSKKKAGAPMKIEKVQSDGKTLRFEVPEAKGGFKGDWNEDKKSWVGRWASEDGPLEMILSRAK
jgi:hypothetical protein